MDINESDIFLLPEGRLLVAMRSGVHGYMDLHGRNHLDQPMLLAWSKDHGRIWTDPQRVTVDSKLITGIYPRILATEEGALAILRTRPDGSVIFSPDGNGAYWSDEFIHYDLGAKPGVPYHAGMQDMGMIEPNTILIVDVVSKRGWPPTSGWHAEGLPITIRKKNK